MEEMKVTLKNFIANNSFSDISKLNDDTLIFREGFFDSMGFISLISFLEVNFESSITDKDLIEDNFESINAIVNFMSKKKAIA